MEYLFTKQYGSAVSMNYLGNGGSIVTLGTEGQVGQTVTPGESAQASLLEASMNPDSDTTVYDNEDGTVTI
jgi:hypothetical protein